MTVHDVELWIMVDEDGAFVMAREPDELADAYDTDVGSDAGKGRRVIKVCLKVPVEPYVELTGDVPAEGTASLRVS